MATLLDQATANEIRQRVERLTPASEALWGKMDVNQMLCHITDGIKMSTGERPVPDDSNILTRTLLKFLVVNVIQMPKNVPTMPEIDQQKQGTKPEEFAADLAEFLSYFDKIVSLPPDAPRAAHPKFGPMTHAQWGKLGFKHLDHHLRQFGV